MPFELTLYTGIPPSFNKRYFCNHQSGQGTPSLSKFFEIVNRLGNRVNIHAAPKKFIFKSKDQTAKRAYQASLIAV